MKLIIFDIDGVITDVIKPDNKYFIQTFQDLYSVNLDSVSWSAFDNITDTGLTIEIFRNFMSRLPKQKEVEKIKTHFKELLENGSCEFREVYKALFFIKILKREPGFKIAFATSRWKEIAELKSSKIGLDLENYVFKSSNDHFHRTKIIQLLIEEAVNKNDDNFQSIIYFGKDIWDFIAAKRLGINFIGVDFKREKKFKDLGIGVIESYSEVDVLIKFLREI